LPGQLAARGKRPRSVERIGIEHPLVGVKSGALAGRKPDQALDDSVWQKEAAMSPHQSYNPPTTEFHPELGYLCPSRQLRQNVRVGLAAAAFGLLAGLAAAVALFPRHGASPSLATPALAVAPSGPASDPPAPLTQVSTDTPDKQPASVAHTARVPEAATKASVDVQAPVQNAPAVNADRGTTAVSRTEHIRTVASKRTRKAKVAARPRGREPYPIDAYAASPFSFETRRFADDTRPARRRDRGSMWSW
jgi:hypothetical protein